MGEDGRRSSAQMGLRDLVMGRPACAAPGSSSSSSNPLRSLADALIGYSPKSEVVPLSTVPGDENEIDLDQGSTRSIKGADFVNGHHGDACGDNFQTSILSVPELRGMGPDLQELEQIDRATSMNLNPKLGKFQH
ncbi:peroxisome biogenesis protein 5-like [Lolium perenne]|uniref:peroxisome biogenesis protein 5-like n=1 Tax=Lolium perenne TaxID=4522 RepID=UPI0021F554F6|nr:peroxisome biogenesis protein 5-like [Lolium perenne]